MSAASALAEKLFEKALLAIKDKDLSKASSILVEAIKLKPDFSEAWVIRGNIRMAQDESFDAILHYDRALELNDKLWDCWNNRGIAWSNLAMWAMAEHSFKQSLEHMPAIEPHMNMANMFCQMMRLEDAEREYRECLKHDPGDLNAHINLGITLLGRERWAEGWKHYEARHANTPYQMKQRRVLPNWTGEDLTGKTIVLYPEQGLGDEIAFMRYATLLKAMGARVILETMPSLLRLGRMVANVDAVYVKGGSPYEQCDYSCAIMDIPMRLELPPGMPWFQRYLEVPPQVVRPKLPPGLNIGVCWVSGNRPLQPEAKATAANKSLLLEWLRPMFKFTPGVNFISLQKEHNDTRLMGELGIIDVMSGMGDLADTAGLIEQLDLVISVDTAVAHLAGALGKPVWNLVRFSGYWPWMHAGIAWLGQDHWEMVPGEQTSWYPSMKIYRQSQMFNWETPLQAVFTDLERFVAEHKQEKAA
jgi:Tfp pilus assembly protein PilF